MGKLRIYELAKELGVENKVIIAKAQELGMKGKKSHSNSLESDEAEQLRRALIREAIGESPDTEVVKTRVVKRDGETESIVERRKGNVIRRRRKVEEEPAVVQETVEEEAPQTEETPIDMEVAPVDEAPVEVVLEGGSEVVQEDASEVTLTEVAEVAEGETETESVSEEASVEEESPVEVKKKVIGPKILGKMELPQPTVRKPKPVPQERERGRGRSALNITVGSERVFSASDDEDSRQGKKKKGRKREFSRGDLVDYDRRPKKRGGRGSDRRVDGMHDGMEGAHETKPKAAKRIIKMSSEVITVGELASQMSLKAGEVITKLIELGVMATINQAIDQDTAMIVADEFDYKIEFTGFDEENILKVEEEEDENLTSRPPVVTVMGHVDHGKTSLLDYIRNSTVASKEHGGITQHIGAYTVKLDEKREIAFIDTPGHEAFTAMRARGAEITDIVVLVIAGDDGVMPQTIEAANHAKAAGVSIIVAVNKMDKEASNFDKAKQQASELGLQPEDWGGDVMFYPVSAHTGQGVDELLEGIMLVSEMKELKANADRKAVGTILESRQEIGRGTVATLLVQAGTMRVGDIFVCGAEFGRVRSMMDYQLQVVDEALPSMPVELTGFNGVPAAGDDFIVVENETAARQVAGNRAAIKQKKDQLALAGGPISLEEFAKQAGKAQATELNIILKADVQGSVEAVRTSMEKLSGEKVVVKVIHCGVGAVNESDLQLAIASKAVIVGFNVRGEPRAMREAESHGIDIRFYRIIYELLDEIKLAMAGLLAPVEKEVYRGRAEIRDTFMVPKIGTVAGCYVQDGNFKRGNKLRLLRDSIVVHEGKMLNLRRFKDDVKEVQTGYECGISFEGYNDLKVGDVIEGFEIEEIAATLD